MKLPLLQQILKEKGINLVILTNQDQNITYFTWIIPSFSYFVITPSTATLYLTRLDQKPVITGIAVKAVTAHWHTHFHGVKRIGINKLSLTLGQLERFKELFPQAQFKDVSPFLAELRSTKTFTEISHTRKACAITSDALSALVKVLPSKKLLTERDVAFFLERYIYQQGAEIAFPTIVAMGKNAAIPHHKTSTTQLKRGFLVIDFGARFQNYCADMTRTLFLGKPTPQEAFLYNLLLQSQQEAIDAVAEKKAFQELDAIVRKRLGKYSSHFIHSLGHGIGIEVHEAPSFSNRKEKVRRDQLFTIEPGIYFPGKFGIRIEDTLLFDGKKHILTSFPKELYPIRF